MESDCLLLQSHGLTMNALSDASVNSSRDSCSTRNRVAAKLRSPVPVGCVSTLEVLLWLLLISHGSCDLLWFFARIINGMVWAKGEIEIASGEASAFQRKKSSENPAQPDMNKPDTAAFSEFAKISCLITIHYRFVNASHSVVSQKQHLWR